MIDKNIIKAYSEAVNYTDKDAYISDVALSSLWGEDAELSETTKLAAALWEIHDIGIKAIVKHSGMSARAFALAYGIPTRTMENWTAKVNTPPDYVLLLLANDQMMI